MQHTHSRAHIRYAQRQTAAQLRIINFMQTYKNICFPAKYYHKVVRQSYMFASQLRLLLNFMQMGYVLCKYF